MDKTDNIIEITKALLSNSKYMKLYEDDMINCINLSQDVIDEITNDAINIVNCIYNKSHMF